MSVKSIKLNSLPRQAGLVVFGFGCLVFLFFAVRWYFGNSISARAGYKEVAEFALDLAPGDPQTHYALAIFDEKTFLPADLQKSLTEYEQAAALAPGDYRVWLGLGKARERSGDAEGAERALRRSLELAPHYAQVHWTLGNTLLRQGKTPEAFDEIRQAAESDVKFAAPAVITAGQIFKDDPVLIKQNLGGSSRINFALAAFFTKQRQFDQALEVWNSIPLEERKIFFEESGQQFFKDLIAAGKYGDALLLQKQFSVSGDEGAGVGKMSNSGFEAEVDAAQTGIFDWQIADGTNPQIGFDNGQKHGGNRSLVMIFNSLDGKEFRRVSQTVVVQANKKYGFEFFYKSALKTSSTVKWEIVDTSNENVLAVTNPVSNNTDWTNLKTELTTSETTEAVTVRLVRDKCQSSICPIAGKVWLDDFNLTAR